MNDKIEKIISLLIKNKNVLLYGPPGTGKTWLVSQIISHIKNREISGTTPTLVLGNDSEQFGLTNGNYEKDEFPSRMNIEWITFHQNYSYDEFIIGKRPIPKDGGIILEPHFGILMSCALNVSLSNEQKGCLLIIDEINRANASQVFGELITLMDGGYRETINGHENPDAINITFPGISYHDNKSEPIKILRGNTSHEIPDDWKFPEHIYILATMNSVDKAALPLDSALTRRFTKVEVKPDVDLLLSKFNLSREVLDTKINEIKEDESQIGTLSAEETIILLLDRFNLYITSEFGDDYEIGHSLVWDVVQCDPADRWKAAIDTWDYKLLPQIIERYIGRYDSLRELFKVDSSEISKLAFTERLRIGSKESLESPFRIKPLGELDFNSACDILRLLAI